MADEKTTPTPKVAPRDTMHSTPDAPDRSKMSAKEREAQEAPPNIHVGSEAPRQRTIKTEKSGTLVEDLKGPGEDYFADGGEGPVNPGNPAPEGPLALQPGEDVDTKTRKKDR